MRSVFVPTEKSTSAARSQTGMGWQHPDWRSIEVREQRLATRDHFAIRLNGNRLDLRPIDSIRITGEPRSDSHGKCGVQLRRSRPQFLHREEEDWNGQKQDTPEQGK